MRDSNSKMLQHAVEMAVDRTGDPKNNTNGKSMIPKTLPDPYMNHDEQ